MTKDNNSFMFEQPTREGKLHPRSILADSPKKYLPSALDRIKKQYDMMDISKNAKNLRYAREETAKATRTPSATSPAQGRDSNLEHRRVKSIHSAEQDRQVTSTKDSRYDRSLSRPLVNRSVQPTEVESVLDGFNRALS